MVHEETRKLPMSTMFPLRSPACDGRFRAPTEPGIGFIQRAPCLALAAHVQFEQLSQVMTESCNERGVLPARAVAGTAETIHAAVWPLLHLHVALELFQSLERDFERMPVESAGRGGARRWLADRPLLRQTFRAAFQPAPAPACPVRASRESVPICLQLTA